MEKTKVDKLKEMLHAKKEAEKQKQKEPEQPKVEQPPAEEPGSADEMMAQIKSAEDEAKAHYDKLLRVMAEFENFKKRIERERIEQSKFSNQSLITDIVPVLDDLDRAIQHIPEESEGEIKALADGVRMVQNHLLTALGKHGLKQVSSAPGEPFDPSTQEAVSQIESKEHKAGTVAVEHRKGWMLHDRLIRPSMVSVSKG